MKSVVGLESKFNQNNEGLRNLADCATSVDYSAHRMALLCLGRHFSVDSIQDTAAFFVQNEVDRINAQRIEAQKQFEAKQFAERKKADTESFAAQNGLLVLSYKPDNNCALLLMKECVAEMPFYEKNYKQYSAYWEGCTLRKWLNEDWLNFHLAQSVKNRILGDYFTPKIRNGHECRDRVFLLTADDARSFFKNKLSRVAMYKGEPIQWWLNTYGNKGGLYVTVNLRGQIVEKGIDGEYKAGVRPAFWVSLDGFGEE